MPAPSTCDELLELVRKSGLADPHRVDAYTAKRSAAGKMPAGAKELAALLVHAGLLTHFQARELLRGRWRGFTFGNYKVLEELSASATGRVYLCEHLPERQPLAAKVCPLLNLKHPNLVRARGIRKAGGYYSLIMEYVDGLSLQAMIEKRGPMEFTRAAHYIHQAAVGLEHVRQARLVHGDINPGNLLVDRGGTVKILHLGLARLFHNCGDAPARKRSATSTAVSFAYRAPEQAIRHQPVDIRTDIYSLGATFYFLLTGRPPPAGEWEQGPEPTAFVGAGGGSVFCYRVSEPTPIRNLRPEVPEELAAVVEKMLAADPALRPQTPAEVAELLVPWTRTPIPAPSPEDLPPLSAAAARSVRAPSDDAAPTLPPVVETSDKPAPNPDAPVAQRSRTRPSPVPRKKKTSAFPDADGATVQAPPERTSKARADEPSRPKRRAEEKEKLVHDEPDSPPARLTSATGRATNHSPAVVTRSSPSPTTAAPRPWLWLVAAFAILLLAGAAYYVAGVRTTGKNKEDHSIPALAEKLKDEDPNIRYWAAKSLGSFGPKAVDAVPTLIQALKDPDDNVRLGAAYALAEVGPDANAAVPTLQESLKDKHNGVRVAAVYALKRIQGGK